MSDPVASGSRKARQINIKKTILNSPKFSRRLGHSKSDVVQIARTTASCS
ncbi:hypothetical protein SXCC_02866 [Gluconacetobacter sp. SXCC-1]|nr:hypothetical protein SXCC_02866 [Gluconacetobacter sp. SXCC-1]